MSRKKDRQQSRRTTVKKASTKATSRRPSSSGTGKPRGVFKYCARCDARWISRGSESTGLCAKCLETDPKLTKAKLQARRRRALNKQRAAKPKATQGHRGARPVQGGLPSLGKKR